MKKIALVLLSVMVAALAAFFCACGGGNGSSGNTGDNTGGDNKLLDFKGITFTDKTVTYDGNEHELTVDGTVPEGADVVYTNNKATEAGVYNASAKISKEEYNTLTLTAKLTINKLSFTGITFTDKTVTYDGNEHEITVDGTVPEGADVVYTRNKGTNVGVYNASVTISKDNYNDLTLTAKLTINKATFTGITLDDKTFVATGSEHSLAISGELPAGSNVVYKNNSKSQAGIYEVTATVTNPNYNDLVLKANLKIVSVPAVAKDVVNSLLDKPDAWSFLPEAMSMENMAYTTAPVSDFTSFVNVSSIGDKIIGKQFNVLYEGLSSATTALGYVDTVYAVGSAIAEVYQNHINSNPDAYAVFEGEVKGFKIKITLNGENSEMLVGNSTVSMELSYDKQSGKRTGRIQITNGIALRYECTEDTLKLAVKETIAGAGNLKQIEFVRNEGAVAGYLYEYTGTETKNLKTSAVIASNSQYTRIMSNKRESDDMTILGYEEVYSSLTGKYIGGEVQETLSKINYDTLWFMLDDVSGFNSVKVSSEHSGTNADTIYVNGAATSFVNKKVGGVSLKTASRRYDIEMKDVWYVVATTDEDGKTKYDTVKYSIPMLFVQIEQTATFGADVKEKNPDEFSSAPSLPSFTAVTAMYSEMQELFNVIKENVTYADINSFIGNKNAFFENN